MRLWLALGVVIILSVAEFSVVAAVGIPIGIAQLVLDRVKPG